MNVPAVLSLARVVRRPTLLLPQYTVPTFYCLPLPLSTVFKSSDSKLVDIRAVVLDKDNCFAAPHTNTVHPSNDDTFRALVKAYTPSSILIVSNSAGLASVDPAGIQAAELEENTGVPVLRHKLRKPACRAEILEHFKHVVTSPDQIVVIGDRLLTDVVMANMMGARSIWIRRGVVRDQGLVTRLEYGLERFLSWRGYKAPGVS